MIRTAVLVALVVGLILPLASSSDLVQPLEYRVVDVQGRLMKVAPPPESRAERDTELPAGTVVKTGWFSSARLDCTGRGAHFKLGPSTRARLAQGAPGLLLEVEKGRLRAWFDHLSEDQPQERIVTTPSAVLAVRGTEYGVTVSRSGDTVVTVFSGVVEVTSLAGTSPPVRVGPGQFCRVVRGGIPGAPMPHTMSPGGFDRGATPEHPGSMGESGMGGGANDPGLHGGGGHTRH